MTNEEIEAIFIELVKTGEIDRITARLAAGFHSSVPREEVVQYVQDAVLACLRKMKTGTKIRKPPAFITKVAKTLLLKHVEQDGEDVLGIYARFVDGAEWDDAQVERRARALMVIKEELATWPTNNQRRALMVMLEAARNHEQLTDRELGEALGTTEGTASSWKSRGLRRLRERLSAKGIDWDGMGLFDAQEGEDVDDVEDEDTHDEDPNGDQAREE